MFAGRRGAAAGESLIEQLRLRNGTCGGGVDRREDAAIHGNQVRRENDLDGITCDIGEGLLYFRRVSMAADGIGRNALVALGEVRGQFWRPPPPPDRARLSGDAFRLENQAGWKAGFRASFPKSRRVR